MTTTKRIEEKNPSEKKSFISIATELNSVLLLLLLQMQRSCSCCSTISVLCAVYFIKSDHVRFVIFLVVCNFFVAENISHFTFRRKILRRRTPPLSLHTWNNTFQTRCGCMHVVGATVCLRSHSKCIWFLIFLFFSCSLFHDDWLNPSFPEKVNVGPLRFLRGQRQAPIRKLRELTFYLSHSLCLYFNVVALFPISKHTHTHMKPKLNALMLLWKSQIGLGGRIWILSYSMFCLLFDMSNFSVYGISVHSECTMVQSANLIRIG